MRVSVDEARDQEPAGAVNSHRRTAAPVCDRFFHGDNPAIAHQDIPADRCGNASGGNEKTNLDITERILKKLEKRGKNYSIK